jgi:hypothetical protein
MVQIGATWCAIAAETSSAAMVAQNGGKVR